MMLREKIAVWFDERWNLREIEAQIREAIDSEPSGLQVERECLWHLNHGLQACVKGMDCPDCHGSGKIIRDLTDKEALEILKYEAAHREIHHPDVIDHAGERVVVKEEK